jgi:AcrR family transcriptional regulator
VGARYVIREVDVVPAVPRELVVYYREDIERFVAVARQTVADLQAELAAARDRTATVDEPFLVDLTQFDNEPEPEPWLYKAEAAPLPPWAAPRPTDEDHTAFFESLRDEFADGLIAGVDHAAAS